MVDFQRYTRRQLIEWNSAQSPHFSWQFSLDITELSITSSCVEIKCSCSQFVYFFLSSVARSHLE